MSRLQQALALAERGFHVFPCEANGKKPVITDFPNRATRDPEQITKWFTGNSYNIGISTTRFGDDKALCVVDIDNKNGKNGDAQLLALELEGHELPPSLEQSTPSGGRHIVYVTERPLKQGVDVLGSGLDIRSRGGYIVGPGSEIDDKPYRQINGHGHVVPAPDWLVHRLGVDHARPALSGVVLAGVDANRARSRAIEYLLTAPVAVEGDGGDSTTFKVACKLKDLGCNEELAFSLMWSDWNAHCVPPWSTDDLWDKVVHAYKYGRDPVGIRAPEAVFTPAVNDNEEDEGLHPFEVLNQSYAYVVQGDHIIWETTDADGNPLVAHLNTDNFHKALASQRFQSGEKSVQLTKAWMNSEKRRTYDGFVFAPERDVDTRWYNLWRGFSVQPALAANHPALDAFLDHALNNVCHGDKDLCHWLIGWFAHMIQRPWEKPLVALVFKGKKGTGKNALIERVGHLLGKHFMVTSKRRHMVGQFNGHLESCLCLTLDEAFWSGDKESEGVLKDLITGSKHTIEHKGKESFEVRNLTRVIIIGNEEWIVPVTHDERRFAVFTMGDARRQDREFFEGMRVGMEQGGYAHLLRFLMGYDISGLDVNGAPKTKGLLDQMHASLPPTEEWWLDCISSDKLMGAPFGDVLPDRIPTSKAYDAFVAWIRQRNIRQRLPDHKMFVKAISAVAPSMEKKRARDGSDLVYSFFNPGIDVLRADWDRFIGGKHDWNI